MGELQEYSKLEKFQQSHVVINNEKKGENIIF